MSKWNVLVAVLAVFLFAGVTSAQESEIAVEKGVVCTGIDQKAPTGANTQFFEEIDRLYCFTHVTGCEAADTISHVWYFGEKEKARVRLPVRSASWRTWSSKRILPSWSGAWRVEILSGSGDLLHTVEFVYKPVAD